MSDIKIILKHDVYRDVTVEPINLRNAIYAGDSAAQRIMFRCWANHGSVQPDDLSQKTVTAHFIRPDGGDVVISGVGGAEWSYVDLPEACYVYPGIFKLLIRVSSAEPDIVTSVIYLVGRIDKPTTDTIIDPGTVIPSLDDLLAQIEACADATEDAQQAASFVNSIIASTYSTGVTYSVGDYCTYEGSMYRATAATSGAFDPDDWDQVLVGGEFNRVNRVAEVTSNALYDSVNLMQFEFGKYYNSSGVIKTSNNRSLGLSQIVTVHPGDMIYTNVPATDSNNVPLIFGIHEFNKSSWVGVTTPSTGDIVTIPDGVDSVRFVFGRSTSYGIALTYADIHTYAKAYIIKKHRKIFDGKRVSIIGTSDSTFGGFIPSENRVYYDGTNYGVSTVGQCWWHIGITENGGIPLINDSWSGSTVAKGVRDATDYRPMVELSRCQNLHAYQHGGTSSDTLVTSENIGTLRHSPWDDDQTAWTVGEYVKEVDPDVVIINGGGNDYTYAAPMGTYDGHTALADDDPLTSFREAYAALINRIQARYPYALVICCTPIFLVRPAMSNPPTETDRNQVNVNSADLTYYDYQSAIKEIATMKGCPVIDGFVHGFSRRNYYSLFCTDSSRNPVHPNALGHMVFGVDFAKNLRNCVFGLTDFA